MTYSTIKKLTLSAGLIIISILYAFWLRLSGSLPDVLVSSPATTDQIPSQSYKEASNALLQTLSQIASTTPAVPAQVNTRPVMVPMMQRPRGLYADGSFIGSVADAYYGSVQVKAIISGGKITDVQFLQYPSDRSTSRYINGQAMPLLQQEAIQAQSAQVDGVSGATFTSQAFIQSLASALALAKN